MQVNSTLNPSEAEHAELNAVMKAFSDSPRLAKLLGYIGEKYFLGEIDQINEYNIATEVFGRSKVAFSASEDAIVRVEAYRLRRALKEFYKSDGKDHQVQICVPFGGYVPVFTRQSAELPLSALGDIPGAPADDNVVQVALEKDQPETWNLDRPRRHFFPAIPRFWMYPIIATGLTLAALGIYLVSHGGVRAGGAKALQSPVQSEIPPRFGPFAAAPVPLHLLSGYSGSPQTDSAGAVWGADRYFQGGKSWRRLQAVFSNTNAPFIFQFFRSGIFSYDIPLKPGVYELHLFFVSSDYYENISTFNVAINGNQVLSAFDVGSDAMGFNVADERVFRDISPASDGIVHLSFTNENAVPEVSGIELLPGTPGKQLPIRLVMQPTPYTDHLGQVWHPDNYYTHGKPSLDRQPVTGTPDPDLFAAERYGHFAYAIPVDTRGRYTLVLHFAEFYFGPKLPGGGGTGSRVFRVMCNGSTLLDDFDIFKEAGDHHEITKTFYHVKPSAQGKINLTFEPILNYATVSGIEVLDESQ
jgi:hypothetical protein